MAIVDQLMSIAQQNNEWSAQQAAKQMEFQERMSNTAHQREIADLQAAGLNPVLSAKLGGASTPSGASASADTSVLSAVVEALKAFGEGVVGSAVSAATSGSGRVMQSPENTALDVSKAAFLQDDVRQNPKFDSTSDESVARKDAEMKKLNRQLDTLTTVGTTSALLASKASPVVGAGIGAATAVVKAMQKLIQTADKAGRVVWSESKPTNPRDDYPRVADITGVVKGSAAGRKPR